MKYPKVKNVKIKSHIELEILFDNGETRLYNISKLLSKSPFDQLSDFNLFKQVKIDDHGYGIYWHDDLDLAESELYDHSIIINCDAHVDTVGIT